MGTGWRPPQWKAPQPQTIIITFPGLGPAPQYNQSGSNIALPVGPASYVFDCVVTAQHDQQLTRTEHPVQTGASISDHAYIVPARLILDIGMSDAMASYYSPSTWTGAPSKSVSCYQTMVAMQYSRVPLLITTRLKTYNNMVIESIAPREDSKTFAGLRMSITFGQIFIADVMNPSISARPQDTDTTQIGTVNPQPTTAAQQQQNNIALAPGFAAGEAAEGETGPLQYNAIGAGNWSSVNTNNQSQLPAAK